MSNEPEQEVPHGQQVGQFVLLVLKLAAFTLAIMICIKYFSAPN